MRHPSWQEAGEDPAAQTCMGPQTGCSLFAGAVGAWPLGEGEGRQTYRWSQTQLILIRIVMHSLRPRKAGSECPQPRAPSRPRPKSLPQTQESHLLRAFCYARDNYGEYLNDLAAAKRLRAQYGPDFDYILERMTNLKDMLPTPIRADVQHSTTGNRGPKSANRDKLILPNTKSSCYLRLGHDATSIADSISLGKNTVNIATNDGIVSIRSRILTQGS